MKHNKYSIILHLFYSLLAFIAIILQMFVLIDLETFTNSLISAENTLAVSIYISLILFITFFSRTIKAWREFTNE